NFDSVPEVNASVGGLCTVLDTRYSTYVDAYVEETNADVELSLPLQYYTGSSPQLDPSSASYDPNGFTGCEDEAGWTSNLPADLSTVGAVRTTFPLTDIDSSSDRIRLSVEQHVAEDLAANLDVWTFGSYI